MMKKLSSKASSPISRETLLNFYDRFTRLVEKLPGGLQKPILRELMPIRELFLEQRPARILLLGAAGKSVPELLRALAGITVETGASDNGWRTYRVPERGDLLVLDARSDTPEEVVAGALGRNLPDAAILIREDNDREQGIENAAQRLKPLGSEIPLVGIALGGNTSRARLAAALQSHQIFAARKTAISSPDDGEATAEKIAGMLPNSARLEFARLTGAREAQRQIASSLLKSFTAVCGVIGLQPIPLADMPILTSLQTLMVGLIIYTTGKPVNARTFAEFLGALGLNIGAGILLREGARAMIKFIPFWGHAISGMVAGAGTYAVGRAAIAYFIEDIPLSESRKLFQKLLPTWRTFASRRLSDAKSADKKRD